MKTKGDETGVENKTLVFSTLILKKTIKEFLAGMQWNIFLQ